MAGICEGRVVIVTGAGRGIGREHALEFARQGADVVVNDLGSELDGRGASSGPASDVAEEVRALGRRALVNGDDVADEVGARTLIDATVEEFGRLDVLVNNAGILRDRMLFNMSFEEWDAVMRVHLRGTFGPAHFAAVHWRERAKAGEAVDARLINTTSPSGIYGNVGQANYGAAKAGIASFTVIAAMELAPYGVTVNAIAPAAATRMTIPLQRPGASTAPEGEFDPRSPDNIAPLVVWLGSAESAGVTGRVFNVRGGQISVAEGWRSGPAAHRDRRWDPAELGPVVTEPRRVGAAQCQHGGRAHPGQGGLAVPLNLSAIGAVSDPIERTWTSKDALLYAVAVGAGSPDVTSELAFTTENSYGVEQAVLPTYVVLLGAGGGFRDIGTFNPAMLVHAEQSVELHQPLPVEGRVLVTGELVDILDKRSGALVVSESRAVDAESGAPVFTARSSAFIRGEGGFADGASTPRSPAPDAPPVPERAPDHEVTFPTLPQQALLYRLCGDRNPLHSDPSFAARAGFDRPILHGLCTYGFAGRALLHALCDGDPTRFRSMAGRFTSPVWPGESLTTSMWVDGDVAAFKTTSSSGAVVIDRGRCGFVA